MEKNGNFEVTQIQKLAHRMGKFRVLKEILYKKCIDHEYLPINSLKTINGLT